MNGAKAEIKTMATGKVELSDRFVWVEAFKKNNESTYLAVFDQTNGDSLYETKELLDPTVIIRPPQKIIWASLNKLPECKRPDLHQLYLDIRKYVYDHVEFANEAEYDLVTFIAMASWVYEAFDTFPMIYLVAPKATGKTRTANILQEIMYHPHKSSNLSESAMGRDSEEKHITLLIDEAEFIARTKPQLLPMINARYKRGDYYVRSTDAGVQEYFHMFGATVICSRKMMDDPIVDKSFVINLKKNSRVLKRIIDKQTGEKLRQQLLLFRLYTLAENDGIDIQTLMSRYMSMLICEENRQVDVIDIYTPIIEKINNTIYILTDERLLDCLHPPLLMSIMSHVYPESLLQYILKVVDKRKEDENASFEAQLIVAITKAILECQDRYHPTYVDIPSKLIEDAFNNELPPTEKINSRSLGKAIVALGFQNQKLDRNTRGKRIIFNLLKELATRYNISLDDLNIPIETKEEKIEIEAQQVLDAKIEQPALNLDTRGNEANNGETVAANVIPELTPSVVSRPKCAWCGLEAEKLFEVVDPNSKDIVKICSNCIKKFGGTTD